MDALTAWGLSKHTMKHCDSWSQGVQTGFIGDDAEEGKKRGRRVWWDPMSIFLQVEGLVPKMQKYFTEQVKRKMGVEDFTEWIFRKRLSFSILRDFKDIFPGCTHSVYAVGKQVKADTQAAYEVFGEPINVYAPAETSKSKKKQKVCNLHINPNLNLDPILV